MLSNYTRGEIHNSVKFAWKIKHSHGHSGCLHSNQYGMGNYNLRVIITTIFTMSTIQKTTTSTDGILTYANINFMIKLEPLEFSGSSENYDNSGQPPYGSMHKARQGLTHASPIWPIHGRTQHKKITTTMMRHTSHLLIEVIIQTIIS